MTRRVFSTKGIAIVVVLAAIAILCAPMLADRSLWMKDIIHFTYSQKFYLRQRLLHGELPMWWPNDGLGRPFYALVQPGVLYPLNVLWLLPMPLAYDVFSAVHLVIAALGTYAWLRRSDCDAVSSALGAAVFALSGYIVSLFANNGVYVFGAAWVPAILAVALSNVDPWRRSGRVALMLALCLSAGEPQAVFFAGIALGVQALARRPRELVPIGVAAGLAGLMGAALLLPGAITAAIGRPGGVPISEAHHFALHPLRLLELIWPSPFGLPFGPGWQISPLVDEGTRGGYQPLTGSIYCGLAVLPLAACALRDRMGRAIAILALVTIVVALGEHAPLWLLVHRFVPLAKTFRYPEKYMMLATLCLAWLAARGLTEVARAPRRVLVPLAVLVVVALIATVAVLVDGDGLQRAMVETASTDPLRNEVVRTLAIALLLFFIALAWSRIRHAQAAFALVTLCELLFVALRLVLWTPSQTYRDRSPVLDEPVIADVLQADLPPPRLYRPAQEDYASGLMLPGLDRATLLPNCGVEDGIAHLDAYYVFHTDSEIDFWEVMRKRPVRLLEWSSTHFALLPAAQLRGAHPGLTLRHAYEQLGISLVEVDHAAPAIYLALRSHVAATHHEAALAMASGELVAGEDAIIEGGEARLTSGACRLVHFLPERVELACEASAPGYAIVADTWFPGWHADVNGSDAQIRVANATMRAVEVPAGASHVVLRYEVPRLKLGAFLSLVGLALAVFLARRRR